MTLKEYAVALERSRDPNDRKVAKYIGDHEQKIAGWLREATQRIGRKVTKEDREDLVQIALLAVAQVVAGNDADTALNLVKGAIRNAGNRQRAWLDRKVIIDEEV